MSDVPSRKTLVETGYCQKKHQNIPVFYEVLGEQVIHISCEHASCKWKPHCDLYNAHPLGSVPM